MIEFLFASMLAAQNERILASPDDCQIAAAIGRSELGWGDFPPQSHFFPERSTREGALYVLDCDWRALNLAPPIIGTAQSPRSFSIDQPTYDPTRRRATASLTEGLGPYAFAVEVCELERRDGGWRLLSCQPSVIS